MNLGYYIHQLLLKHETVIIPGFGAFISSYRPAGINDETGEMLPPSKEVVFNAKIRNNDGLLVGTIAEGEKISHFDALRAIEKEKENLIYQLDKTGKHKLEEVGELSYDENNEVHFTPFHDDNLLLDSFGLESFDIEEMERKEESVDEESVIPVDTSAEEPGINAGENLPEGEEETVEEKETKEPLEKESKKTGIWWFALILIPVIGVGIYLYMQKENSGNISNIQGSESPEIIQSETVLPADSIAIDTVIEQFSDTVPLHKAAIDSTEVILKDSTQFYLVGGSFKAEENANTFLEELKDKGYDPFHLGKQGNFYIVAIGKYNSEREAMDAKINNNQENPNSGVWILKLEK